jgi:hypothetical protein
MKILILSKTRMHGNSCIGGITTNGKYVRLLTSSGNNQPENTEFNMKQIWEITYIEQKNVIPPHVEDVMLQAAQYEGMLNNEIKVLDYIRQRNVPIWKGHPDMLFDGLLKWTVNGSGYITKEAIPAHSVGFWISDGPLKQREYEGKVKYNYPYTGRWRRLPFIGYQNPPDIIPTGTLLRVSLARWWQHDDTEERCYLQLSGWYDL